jgi:hypothetical protein
MSNAGLACMTLDSILNSGLGLFALIWLSAIATVLLLTRLGPVLRVLGWALLVAFPLALLGLLLLDGDDHEHRRRRHYD